MPSEPALDDTPRPARRYTPHVTLLHDGRHIEAEPVEPIGWTVREIVLVHSPVGQTTHRHLMRLPLRGRDLRTGRGDGGGEQPIDVAYTILALSKFYDVFNEEHYLIKIKIPFDWYLGQNHLNQIIYNPCTGGCYDGLEDNYVNLNQGAESAVSYLMARLTVEKYLKYR